jgi:hypothetical protein
VRKGVEQFDGWDVAKAAWGLLVSAVTFLFAKQLRRIDLLEREKANKDETDQRYKELREDIREVHECVHTLRRETTDRLDRIIEKFGK